MKDVTVPVKSEMGRGILRRVTRGGSRLVTRPIVYLMLPATIAHELCHYVAYRYFGCDVEVRLLNFKPGTPVSFCKCDDDMSALAHGVASLAPFALLVPVLLTAIPAKYAPVPLNYLFLYLGITGAISAVPSDRDLLNIWLASHETDEYYVFTEWGFIATNVCLALVAGLLWIKTMRVI